MLIPCAHIRRSLVLLVAAALLLAGTSANAQSICSNTIDGTDTYLQNPFTTGDVVDPNLTVSGIGRGAGLSGNTAGNRYNARSWSFDALDEADYFTWTLTPSTGYEIDFTSVNGAWQRSSTGPNQFALRTSLDSFGSDIATGSITGSASPSDYNIDLSALQNISSTIEFRLYAWGGSNANGTFSINDFSFNGSVVPSEVTTPTLAGDYNGDDSVDAADYTIWRDNEGAFITLANETVSPGVVDAADYDEWKLNFGATGGGGSIAAVAVPEPIAAALLALAAVSGLAASARNRRIS